MTTITTPALPNADAPAADALPHEPAGCGWYESSHALCRGMQVIEHRGFELLRDLPLAWQLSAYFGADVAAGRGAVAAAG